MADGVQIPIEVIDKFSKQLEAMESKLGSITKAAEKQQSRFNILAADIVVKYGREALNAVTGFAQESLAAFAEQELANKRLQVAMQNLGVFTAKAHKEQLDFAAALQLTTTYSDDAIIGIQTQLTSFGLYGEQLKKVTKATLDLASGQGIDLSQAAQLVGKAYQGQTETLGRLGIKIKETGDKGKDFDAVLRAINSRFSGQATAAASTYSGQVKILANQYDELKETIGKLLSDDAVKLLTWTTTMVVKTNEFASSIDGLNKKGYFGFIEKTALGAGAGILAMLEKVGLVDAATKDLLTSMIKVQQAAAGAAPGGGTPGKPAGVSDAEGEAMRAKLAQERLDFSAHLNEQAMARIASATLTNAELADLEAEQLATKLEIDFQFEAAQDVRDARRIEKEKALNAQRTANFKSTLGTISTLATAHNKVLAGIGKAAAIGQATIDTFVAANVALRSAPPPFNFILAGLVTAAGMANVAKIGGVELAEGGMVRSRSGGVAATLAEAGHDEVAIPLDDPRTKARLADTFGGARGTVVNFGDIQVTVMAGNLGDPRDRANAIEQFIEELKAKTAAAIDFSLLTTQLAAQNPLRAV